MKRKPSGKAESAISPEILDGAKRSVGIDRPRAVEKCVVCGSETSTPLEPTAADPEKLCWVCRRLKISAWRDVEQQAPVQE